MKKHIKVWDYAGRINEELEKGILLTTKSGDKVNSMTIGWGFLGIQWAKPVFVVLVRESRYTKALVDKNPEFTINVPYGEYDKRILGFCGTKSGRDVDKIKEMNLTIEDPEVISVPGFRELPLTLECKVLYTQAQNLSALPEAILSRYYPQDVDGSHPGSNRDYHIAFYGEIVASYIIETCKI